MVWLCQAVQNSLFSFHLAKRTHKFRWTFWGGSQRFRERDHYPKINFPSKMEKTAEWWSSWGKQTSLSASFGALFSLLLFKWLEAELRLQLHPLSRYYGNTIWAYQDLKPKDILDNNTIAAQPGYLRDLDLRGEIWGAADWESKSSLFLYLPHTNSVRISLLLGSVRSGTMHGIDLFLSLSFY